MGDNIRSVNAFVGSVERTYSLVFDKTGTGGAFQSWQTLAAKLHSFLEVCRDTAGSVEPYVRVRIKPRSSKDTLGGLEILHPEFGSLRNAPALLQLIITQEQQSRRGISVSKDNAGRLVFRGYSITGLATLSGGETVQPNAKRFDAITITRDGRIELED